MELFQTAWNLTLKCRYLKWADCIQILQAFLQADVLTLTAMDMSFFCLTKVFPWVGSWTLFLMTAGCCEEHCWAGWKWNDHQWEHLLFFWHDLQHKVWDYEKNIQSCFQQLQSGGVAKSHNSEHHLDASASNVVCIAVICNSVYHILSQGQKFLPRLDSGSWWSL